MKILSREFLKTPTPSVHAASIAFYEDHPVFSWFGGSREGNPDIAIYLNNLNNDGQNILIGSKDRIPRWNPILVPINDKLILFEKSGVFCDRWQTFVHDISNWSNNITEKEIFQTAIVLPAGLNGPVKSCPIIDEEGYIVCGSSVETIYDWTSYIETFSIFFGNPIGVNYISRSRPLNIKTKTNFVSPRTGVTSRTLGVIQPTLWATKGPLPGDEDYQGRVYHAFFRSSRGLGKVYYSRSYVDEDEDFDNEWTLPVPTNLDNPNSAVDVVYHNDRLFLVHNPSTVLRNPLVLSEIDLFYDGSCAECQIKDQIEITNKVDENIPLISRELSYPYMIEHGGKLHLVYTYGRVKIEYITIEI